MPRVGNQDFANWVDQNLGGRVTHINNEKDPIPIVPGRFLGFHHPSGEVHITDPSTWENCPGEFSSFSGRAGVGFFFAKWNGDVNLGRPRHDVMSKGVGGVVHDG